MNYQHLSIEEREKLQLMLQGWDIVGTALTKNK